MELVDYLKPRSPGKAEEETVLKGVLVKQGGKDYAKIDNQTALWGPVQGAESLSSGDEIVVIIDQQNQLYVAYPNSGGGGDGSGGVSYRQLIGDGASRDFTVTHNLGSKDVQVMAYRTAAPYDEQVVQVEHTDANTVTVRVNVVIGVNELTVVCSGPGTATGSGAGGDLNYVHSQGSPSDTWNVAHNLGKFGAVDVVDTGGSAVIPTVQYVDLNNVILKFGSPTTGKAYVN